MNHDVEKLIIEVGKLNAETAISMASADAEQKVDRYGGAAGRYCYESSDQLITDSLRLVVSFALIPRASLEYTQTDFEEIKSLRDGFKARLPFWRDYSEYLTGLAQDYPEHDWGLLQAQISRLIEQTEVL